MKIEKYALKAEGNLTVFEFVSEGPKGLIQKLIQFQETNQSNLYNLAFGDKNLEPVRLMIWLCLIMVTARKFWLQ